MIGRLRGMLVARSAETATVDVGGVGYEIVMSPDVVAALPAIGEEVVVHTHLHVREDVMALYGFDSADARDLFRVLLGVSGIGPRVGMAILATLSPDDLRRAVVAEDVGALTAVPGIGKRSAQKLLLELRPRLELPDAEVVGSGGAAEIRAGLEALGYRPEEIREAVSTITPGTGVEEGLRQALRLLGRER